MSSQTSDYRFLYTGIFSLNYFVQGINQSIFATVVPVYLLEILPTVDLGALSFMLSFVLMPFILKIIYGILSDKVKFKKFGRRKPWIIGPASFSGLIWILIAIFLTISPLSAIIVFTYGGFLTILGIAMADTAMDGFILDICPKNLLGRTTGTVWAVRSIGIIIGGPLILLILLSKSVDFKFVLIGLGIITIIFSFFSLAVKHKQFTESVPMIQNLKVMFKKGENWKVYAFSLFMAIVDGVIFVFLALFILIKLGLIEAEGATTSTLTGAFNLYPVQAFIAFLTGIGVFAGAILGGQVADKKSRRASVFIKLLLTTGALALLLIPLPSSFAWIYLIFAVIVGSSSGWSNSAFSAVTSQYSQQYPQTPSTYFSVCTSFVNLGTQLGLIFTGMIFNVVSGITTSVLIIYAAVFISMIVLSNLAFFPFIALKRENYELTLEQRKMKEDLTTPSEMLKP
jgi:PAT family beta-lactamase induction signal transducer AmpG